MRKAVTGFWWSPTIEGTPALVVTAAFFALGSLIGYFWASQANNGEGAEIFAGYLERFIVAAQSGGIDFPDFSSLLWQTLRWPFVVFLCGFTALGLIGVPILAGVRGFFLAFSIAAFSYVYGRQGLMLAFLLLGVPGLITIPVFFLLTTQSFTAAWILAGRGNGQGKHDLPYRQDYFLRCGLCSGVMCVALLLERYLVPILIVGIAGTLA